MSDQPVQPAMLPMQRLALIGVGLIGGSAAAAWRAAGLVKQVVGFDADQRACAAALAAGVIDAVAPGIEAAVQDADLVLLAVPVGAMEGVMQRLAPALAPFAVVTDVGSTKMSVIEAARSALAAGSSFSLARFVPGHPIAGRERPGVENADAGLFKGKLFIATPLAQTHPGALAAVEQLWAGIGAQVVQMPADEHDRIFAAVSHLPHVLAFALVASLAERTDGGRALQFAGAGFRDFTRIAASSPVMWRDVALANRTALSAELTAYRAMLDRLQRAVDQADATTLEHLFDLASRTRRAHARQFDAE
jgi:prephenate dehydrogenase